MDNHTTPKPVTQLEYARMIEATHGPQTPVTWLSVGDLIALLEAQQPQAVTIPLLERVTW